MNPLKETVRALVARAAAAVLRRRSSPLPAIDGVVLVVAPHPDDETLGCGGLIARQARAGRRVHVLFVTDGEASHRGHPVLDAARIASLRREEAIAALTALGVANPRSAATFLGLPDGQLHELAADDRAALIEVFAKWLLADQPEVVCAPFLGGGSSEHDAVAQLLEIAIATTGGGVVVEYPVWAWWNAFRLRPRWRMPGDNWRLTLGTFRAVKQQALGCYPSQIEPVPPWPEPVLPGAITRPCCGPDEFFFRRRIPARAKS